MNIDRDRLMAAMRVGIVLAGIISMMLIYQKWTNQIALLGGCAAVFVYSLAVLLLSGKIERAYLYNFCAICDLFISILLILSIRHIQNPFVLLFMVLILSLGIGRSLIKNLLFATVISAVYYFVYRYPSIPGRDHMLLWSNQVFTIAMIYLFSAGGALLAARPQPRNEEETPPQPPLTAITPAAVRESGSISWQIPKTLEEAYAILKEKNVEAEKIRQDFQVERQMNNTIRSISHSIATLKDLVSLYGDIVTKTRGEVNAQSAFLMRLENNRLKVKYYDGSLSEITMKVFETSMLFNEVVISGKSINLGASDSVIIETHFMGTHEKIKSLLCFPLKTQYEPKPFGLIGLANYLMGDGFMPQHQEFLRLISVEAAVAIKNIEYLEDIEKKYDELILGLARAIEAKDNYTQEHVDRVRDLSWELSIELGCSEEMVRIIKTAATLHDVGKIGTPDHILGKQAALNDEEWAQMKNHARLSATILAGISSLEKEVLPLVLHHHERYDGKGYPEGLKGDQIPLGARIIAVADTFDAMTSDRPYRKGFPKEVALRKMKEECDGTQFDSAILAAFIKMMSRKLAREQMQSVDLTTVQAPQPASPDERPKQNRIIDINYIRKGNDHGETRQ